jgi:hypothetical protein
MSKTLDLNYYKIKVNDESKETKCTHIIICEISNPNKRKHCLNIWNKYWKHVEIERNHKVQYDYDIKFIFTETVIDYNSIKDLICCIWIFLNKHLKLS